MVMGKKKEEQPCERGRKQSDRGAARASTRRQKTRKEKGKNKAREDTQVSEEW